MKRGPESRKGHAVRGVEKGPSHLVNTASDQMGHQRAVCCGLGHGGGADSGAWKLASYEGK